MIPARMLVPENAIHYLEIVTKDVAVVRSVYEAAYGWRFTATGPELGHAFVAEMPNGARCGIRAPMHDQEKPITRTYLRVADLDRAVKTAEGLGALVALPPVEIAGHGRIAITILGGVEQGLWQVP